MIAFDFTIGFGTIISILTIAATGLAAWVTTRNRVKTLEDGEADRKVVLASMQATHKLLSDRVEDIRAKSAHELAEFKLLVARDYATNNAIREVEERVVAAIERLGDRLDKFVEAALKERGDRETTTPPRARR
jgi:biopolymer transport protein ExbB/TolQ